MTWATNSVADAIGQLQEAVLARCHGTPIPPDVEVLRTPVALMFVRGDREGPGASLAKQVVSSFGYWNLDSGKYLDLVFFGWYKDGETIGFQPPMFLQARDEVQRISRWRHSSETDVLLLTSRCPSPGRPASARERSPRGVTPVRHPRPPSRCARRGLGCVCKVSGPTPRHTSSSTSGVA